MYTQTEVFDQPSLYLSNQENTRVKVGILKLVDQDYEVFRGENYIGRSDICDIIINNPNISGKHAVIEVEDEESHVISDCGSKNETKLGQIKLKPNIRYNLKDGDLITFADCITTYIKVENIAQDKDDTGSESLFCDPLVPETPFQMRLKNHKVSEIVVPETPEPEDMTNVLETSKVNRYVTKKTVPKENVESGFIIGNNSVSEAETQLNEKLYCKPKVSRLGSKLFEDDDSFDDDFIPATQDEKKDVYEENLSFNDPTKNYDNFKHSLNDDILNRISPERQVKNSNTMFLNSKFQKVVQVLEKKELQNPICDAETHLASLQKESDIILFSQDSIYGKVTQIRGLENEEKSFIQDKVTHPVRNMILKVKESNDTFDMEIQAPEFDKELSVDNVKKQVNDSINIFTTTSRIMRSSNVRSAIKEKQNKNLKNKESLKKDFSEAISDDISNALTQINTRISTSVENGIEEHIANNCDELTQVNINIGDLKSKANKKKVSNEVNTSMVNKSLNSTINKKNVSKNEPISEEIDISDDCTQINICINPNKNTDEVQLRIDENKSYMHVVGSNSEKSLKLNEELTQANFNLKSVYDVPCVSSRLEDMSISEVLTQINYNLHGKEIIEENKIIEDFSKDKDPIFDVVTRVPNSHILFDGDNTDNNEKIPKTKSSLVGKDIKSTVLHRKVLDINDESNELESLLAIVSEDMDKIVEEENNKFDDTEDPRNKTKPVSKCDSHKPLKGDNNSNEISKLETSVLGLNMSNTDDTNFDFSVSLLQKAVAASEATLSPGLKPVYSDNEVINLPQRGRRTNRTRRYTKKMLDFLNSHMDKTIVQNINLKRQSNIVSENICRETMKINQYPVVELTRISTEEIDSYVIKNKPEDENVFQENNIKDKQKSKFKKLLDKDISEDSSHERIQEKNSNTSLIIVGSNSEEQKTVTTDAKCKEYFINKKSSLLTNMIGAKSKHHEQGSEINTFTRTGKVSVIDLNVSIPCTLKSKRSNVLKKHSVDEEKKSKKIVNKESAKQNSKKQSRLNNNKELSCTNNTEKSVSHNTTKKLDSRRCIRKNTNTISVGKKLFVRSTRRTVVENNLMLKEIIDKQVNKSKRKIQKSQQKSNNLIIDSRKINKTGGISSSKVTAKQNVNILRVVEDSVNLKIIPSKKTCGTVTGAKAVERLKVNEIKQHLDGHSVEDKSNHSTRSTKASNEDMAEKLNARIRNNKKAIDLIKGDVKKSTLKGTKVKADEETFSKKSKENKAKVNEEPFSEKSNHLNRSGKASEDLSEKLNLCVRNPTKTIDLVKEDIKESTCKIAKVKVNEEPKKLVQNETKVEIKLSTVDGHKSNLTRIYEYQEKKQNSRKTKAVDDLNEVLPVKKSKRIATGNKLTMSIVEDFNTPNPDDTNSSFLDETQQKLTSVRCKKDFKIVDFKRNKRGRPQNNLNNKRAKYETSEQFDSDMVIIQSNSSLIYDENHAGHCSISNYKKTGTEMKKLEKNSINQGRRKEEGKFIDDSEIISHISSTQLNSLNKHEDCVISDNEDTPNRSSASPATRMMGRRGEKVLFTGMSDPKLKAVVKKLGGTIVDSPQRCSVLVTEKIRGTVKLLCCIGRGIPIVSPKWIEESMNVGRLLDPWKHLIKDKETENKFSFCLEKSLNLAKRALFLKNYSVYVTPSVKPSPSDLKGIVESCGGEFLDEESESCPSSNCIIISCNEDKNLWEKMKNKNTTPLIVNSDALLSGVLQQRLDVETYRLG